MSLHSLTDQLTKIMNQITETTSSRRQLLQTLGGGIGVLSADSMWNKQARANASVTHFPPRAKRVIHLFMNGGPFQADLFDPKPALSKFYKDLDPTNSFNPGIGKTSKKKYWN